jgi:hypothetical protein
MALTYQLLANTTLGSNQSSFQFTSIPSGYTDLYAICSLRDGTSASPTQAVRLTVNNEGGDLNSMTMISGSGASIGATRVTLQPNIYGGAFNGNNSGGDYYSVFDWYIPNYLVTQNRQMMLTMGTDMNNSGQNFIMVNAGLVRASSTVTSLQFNPNGQTFRTNSSFYLYGIKSS